MGSALDRSEHDALVEVLLQERVDDHERQRRDDDDAELDLVCGLLLGCGIHVGRGALRNEQQLLKYDLQWLLLVVGDEDQACHEVVPVADEVVQADDGENRGAQRDHDPEEVPEVAFAIQLCGFEQLFRD